MAWKINHKTGIGTNTETGATMPIQAPNPNVNEDGSSLTQDSQNGLPLTPSEFKHLQSLGVTENDLARNGTEISLKFNSGLRTKLLSFRSRIDTKDLSPNVRDMGNKLIKEGGFDPYAEAAKYGYTEQDFANDPGFLNYWKNKTPQELKAQLMKRGDFDAKGGTKVKSDEDVADEGLTEEQKNAIKLGHGNIDEMLKNGDINEAEAAVLHEIYSGEYTSGQKIPDETEISRIIADAASNAEKDLSPYYEKITGREIEDLKNQMADIRNESARFAQEESSNYSQKLASTKKNLRARGLTFSGASRSELGAQAFREAQTQQQRDVEGQLPMDRRFAWENKAAGYQERARDIGTEAERRLGSTGMPSFDSGFLNPYNRETGSKAYEKGRTSPLYIPAKKDEGRYVGTGDIALDRKKEIEKSKWDRISKYRSYS